MTAMCHYQQEKQRALGMFELFGRTGPPISGGAVCGENKLRVVKIFSSFGMKLFQIYPSPFNAV